MGRAPCCSKVGLHRGPWTAREDALLMKYIETHGEGQWRSMPKKAGLLRCGKSCRLRWMNYLRPDIKRGNITPEEDDLIIRLHGLLGNRWSLIAGRLPGRTDNEIKNYWNTHLSKRLRSQGTDPNTHKKIPESEFGKRVKFSNKKRNKSIAQNASEHKNKNDDDVDQERERTKIHLPKPVRVTSVISLTRNNSNGSFETTTTTTTSATSSSQSQSQSHGLTYDESENIILDMPWLSNNANNMVDDTGPFDHLMIGSCVGGDSVINFDIIQPHDDNVDLATPDSSKQFEKLYEEYLQLIKADHHGHDGDDDDNDDDEAQLDSFTESFFI